MHQSLENSDRLVAKKNQDISELNSRLAAVNQKVSERDTEIENLESDLADRSQTPSKTSALVKTDFEALDAANLLNKLKTQRKKSRTDLRDIETLLEILNQEI